MPSRGKTWRRNNSNFFPTSPRNRRGTCAWTAQFERVAGEFEIGEVCLYFILDDLSSAELDQLGWPAGLAVPTGNFISRPYHDVDPLAELAFARTCLSRPKPPKGSKL
jgi:hypothetical protein